MKQVETKGYLAPEVEVLEILVEQGFAGSIYELNYSDRPGASGDIDEVIDGGSF